METDRMTTETDERKLQKLRLADKELTELTKHLHSLKIIPSSLLITRARLYEKTGQTDKALTDVRDALQIEPGCTEAVELLRTWTTTTSQHSQGLAEVMEILNSITTSESGAKEKLENVKNLLRILQSQKDVCHSLTKDSTVMSSLMKTALRCGKADEEQAVACKLWECIYSLSVESRDNALMLVAAFTELADSTLDFLTSEIPENVRSLVIESLVVVSQHLTDSQRDVSTPPLVHLLITATLNPSIDSSAQKQLVQGLVKIVSTPNLSQLCTTHTNFSNVMRCIGSSNDSLRSVTTALLIRLYELSNDTTRSAFIKTVQELVGRWIGSVSATDKTCGFRLLTGLFHTHTQTGVETLYSLQHDIVSILETIDMESDEVQLAVVDGMSAGCVSDTCRDLFKRNCPQFLESIAQRESDSELKRTSLAVLSKLLVGGGAGGTGKGGVSVDGLVESCIASLLMNETTTTKTDPRKHLSTIEALVMLTAAGHPKLKNKLCSHSQLLSRLISLGLESKGESTLQFGVCSVFLNLAMYPKRLSAEEEQVIKLRRMAKDSSVSQNDEEVEPDADVEKRNVALVNAGLVPLLVSLSSSKPSENLSITLSLLFLTLATTPSNRGKMVQQGSLKALQTLIRHCSTPTGDQPNDAIVKNASHALSKILISVDPNVAFKGVNEAIECVGPLLKLCTDPDGLCQFESMLALTNLSSLGPSVRSHMVSNQGVKVFESHLLSSHVLIRRAAAESLCNLMYEETVYERYVTTGGGSQRLKIMVALSDTEDVLTNRAASGVLAILSGTKHGCLALLNEPRFGEVVQGLVVSGNGELEHRGLECVKNVLAFVPDKKQALISRPVLEIVVQRASSAGPLQSVSQEILSHLSKS